MSYALTIIWVLNGAHETDVVPVFHCPTPYQVMQYAASHPMRRGWRIRKWTCETAS